MYNNVLSTNISCSPKPEELIKGSNCSLQGKKYEINVYDTSTGCQ
jgi:hypothetical protein